MTNKSKPRRNLFSLFFGILIDLVLMVLGAGIYLYFTYFPSGPVIFNPIVVQFFGSQSVVVLIVSGLLFFTGLFNLLRTIFRLFKR